jgi:hypothetical protein
MPLLDSCHVLTGSTPVASVHVLASSPEIGTKFPEVFFPDHLPAFRRWAAEFILRRRTGHRKLKAISSPSGEVLQVSQGVMP